MDPMDLDESPMGPCRVPGRPPTDPDGPQYDGSTHRGNDEYLGGACGEWVPVWLQHQLEFGPWLEYTTCQPTEALQQPAASGSLGNLGPEHALPDVRGPYNNQWPTQCVSSHPPTTS